jgi:hypothetical protein
VKELRKSAAQLEGKLGAEAVKKIVTEKLDKLQFYLTEAETKKGTKGGFENIEKARDVVFMLSEPSYKVLLLFFSSLFIFFLPAISVKCSKN